MLTISLLKVSEFFPQSLEASVHAAGAFRYTSVKLDKLRCCLFVRVFPLFKTLKVSALAVHLKACFRQHYKTHCDDTMQPNLRRKRSCCS